MCIYIYLFIHLFVYIYIYIYTCTTSICLSCWLLLLVVQIINDPIPQVRRRYQVSNPGGWKKQPHSMVRSYIVSRGIQRLALGHSPGSIAKDGKFLQNTFRYSMHSWFLRTVVLRNRIKWMTSSITALRIINHCIVHDQAVLNHMHNCIIYSLVLSSDILYPMTKKNNSNFVSRPTCTQSKLPSTEALDPPAKVWNENQVLNFYMSIQHHVHYLQVGKTISPQGETKSGLRVLEWRWSKNQWSLMLRQWSDKCSNSLMDPYSTLAALKVRASPANRGQTTGPRTIIWFIWGRVRGTWAKRISWKFNETQA